MKYFAKAFLLYFSISPFYAYSQSFSKYKLNIKFKIPLTIDYSTKDENGRETDSYKALAAGNDYEIYRVTFQDFTTDIKKVGNNYKLFKTTFLKTIEDESNSAGASVKRTNFSGLDAVEVFEKSLFQGKVFNTKTLYLLKDNYCYQFQISSSSESYNPNFSIFLKSISFSQTQNSQQQDPSIHIELAKKQFGEKKISDAVQSYNKAIQISPNHELALIGRATCYMALAKWDNAIPDCDKAIKINPNQAVAFFIRGCAKNNTGKDGCNDLLKSKSLGYEMGAKAYQKYCY